MTEKSKELTDLHQGISVVQVSHLAIGKLAAMNLSFDHLGQKCDPKSLVQWLPMVTWISLSHPSGVSSVPEFTPGLSNCVGSFS